MNNYAILGTGSYLPEKIIDNFFFEKKIDTTDKWIRKNTGIANRRFANVDENTSDLAINASKIAIQKAGVKLEDISVIVVSRAFGDYSSPAVACKIQKELKCVNAVAFDIIAGCTGFIYALEVSLGYLMRLQYNGFALVIASELLSRDLDFSDRNSCIFLGDGAGAVVIGSCNRGGILGSYLSTKGEGYEWVTTKGGGTKYPASEETLRKNLHYFKMDGRMVFEYAVKEIPRVTLEVLKQCNFKASDIDIVVPHQANLKIIERAMEELGIPMSKVITCIKKYGNTSSASIPIALDEAIGENKIKSNNLVLLVGIGSGMTSGASLIKWK